MDPRVVDAMLPFMTEQYGNPHSRTHLYGWEAEDAVEEARAQVAALVSARSVRVRVRVGVAVLRARVCACARACACACAHHKTI